MRRGWWMGAMAGMTVAASVAGQPYLVKDIRTTPGAIPSLPEELVDAGGRFFFTASLPHVGRELWTSDGTAAGTVMLRDFAPGYASGAGTQSAAVSGGVFYFPCATGLCRSDGTPAGTREVARVVTWELTEVNGVVLFRGADPLTLGDAELWRTDGTAAGTYRVRDIFPGLAGGGPGEFTEVNGVLYFVAQDGSSGNELWTSDGTTLGTVLVRDIVPGPGSSNPGSLVAFLGDLYFSADDGTSGRELWRSDGTAAGTSLVADIRVPGSSGAWELTATAATLFFLADDGAFGPELWKSDGSGSGTVLVKDITPGAGGTNVREMAAVGGAVFLSADDGISGVELWRSDGTSAGTLMVADIAPGPASSGPWRFRDVGGVLYFSANDGTRGTELWKSDGTSAGTTLVRDLNPGSGSSEPAYIIDSGGRAYFSATDGALANRELWTSDGTAAGTFLVRDLWPGADSWPRQFRNVADTVYFDADDGIAGRELWRSDGTNAGTLLLKDLLPGPGGGGPRMLTDLGLGLCFFGLAGGLWWSDGTTAGTTAIYPVLGFDQMVPWGGALYFSSCCPGPFELWRTDGTPAGTWMVKNVWSGNTSGDISDLTPVSGLLFFLADDVGHETELWKSDGTSAGTVKVVDLNPAGSGAGAPLAAMGSDVYFVGNDGAAVGLFRSDGAATGTVFVKALGVWEMLAIGSTLYLSANDAVDWGLWRSDGTPAGTTLLRSFVPGPAGNQPYRLTELGGILYFVANDPATGWELWRSDGTTAGTTIVKDIVPGPGGYPIREIGTANGALYFDAYDSSTGVELWTSRGDAASTVRVADIFPGAAGSQPFGFEQAGPILYFGAWSDPWGIEPWALAVGCPPVTVSPPSLPSGTAGVAYGQTMTASGGEPPHLFRLTAGALPPGLALSPSGLLAGTPTSGGSYGFDVTAWDAVGCRGVLSYLLVIDSSGDYVLGEGLGNTSANTNRVRVHRLDGTFAGVDFQAYGAGQWGTNVAVASIDAGAWAEVVTGPGPGAVYGPHVRGFDRNGAPIAKVSFYAYGTLRSGANVAAGSIDADGPAELLTGPGPGVVFGPHVRGFDYDGLLLSAISRVSYYAYGTLRYGVNVEEGDLDRDGFTEILTGPGPGPSFGATVKGWNYDGTAVAAMTKVAYNAFTSTYGVNVAGGDVDGDGDAEIAAAPGPGPANPSRLVGHDDDGGPIVALPGFDVTPWTNTFYGARCGLADLATDGSWDLLAGRGPDPAADSEVRAYMYGGGVLTPLSGTPFLPFTAAGYAYGVNVAGGALGR